MLTIKEDYQAGQQLSHADFNAVAHDINNRAPFPMQPVVWGSLSNEVVNGNKISYVPTANQGYDGAATGTLAVANSANAGEIARLVVPEGQAGVDAFLIGFSTAPLAPGSSTYSDIKFAVMNTGTNARVFELGSVLFDGNSINKRIEIRVFSNAIKYYVDGSLVYTSLVAPTFPLYVVNAMHRELTNDIAASIANAQIGAYVLINSAG